MPAKKNLRNCRACAVWHEIASKSLLRLLSNHTRSLWYGLHDAEEPTTKRQSTETRRQRPMHYLRGG